MSEKQGTSEGVYGGALQDPRDRVKAPLPASQFPAVEPHTRRDHAWMRRHHEHAVRVSRCVLFT